jgi:hypothetical protein
MVDLLVTTESWSIYGWDDGSGGLGHRHVGSAGWTSAALDTVGSWVEMQHSSGRGIGFMHGDNPPGVNTHWWIAYFVNGYANATDGGAKVFDSTGITERQNLLGSSDDGAQLFPADNTYRLHVAADDLGSFAVWAWLRLTYVTWTLFGVDITMPDAIEDGDPWVLFAEYVSSSGTGSAWSGTATPAKCFVGRTGATNPGTWITVSLASIYIGGSAVPVTNTFVQNPLSGRDFHFIPFWGRCTASFVAPWYVKGTSAFLRWNMAGRSLPITATESAPGDRVPHTNLLLPWETGTDPRA